MSLFMRKYNIWSRKLYDSIRIKFVKLGSQLAENTHPQRSARFIDSPIHFNYMFPYLQISLRSNRNVSTRR